MPQWTGREDIADKTLLIHCEQGFGDVIQFSHYALNMIVRGVNVVFGAPRTLHPPLQSMHGSIKTIISNAEHPNFDFQCPVMSLPNAFSTRLDSAPAPCLYYFANAALQAAWAKQLDPHRLPRMGLIWFGNPKHLHDHRRSLALEALQRALELPLELHSLQQETRAQDAEELAALSHLQLHGPSLTDFSQTASLIANLDLVVTVDTSIAHLAAVLGKPVWVLVHAVPAYRWLLER